MARLGSRAGTHLALCLLWSAGIALGLYKTAVYTNTSNEVSAQPQDWPAGAGVKRAAGAPVLLLTLHPHCPCSRATLAELARLLAKVPAPPQVEILLYEPGTRADWGHSTLAGMARAIPGVVVRPDRNGVEAGRFGLTVSGQAALYSPDGRLVFSGGLTGSRGHEGANAGRSAVESLLSGREPATRRTRVFGCSILDRR